MGRIGHTPPLFLQINITGKAGATILLCFVALALFSCSNGLLKDPRLYNSKRDAGGDSALVVAPEPELDLTGGVDTFDDLEKWYNKKDSNGNENDDKLNFPAEEFQQMSLVGTYFNNSNVPVYAMQKGDVWSPRDTAKGEFVHANAPDTEGQGYGISKVHWYQYRGRNPLYDPNGGYNSQLQSTSKGNPKLSRFYFYRFTGQTLSPSLDNFLFAVDTYSKLMFAFAKPTASKSVFGNNVPTAWGPTDNEAYKDGITYQFYMYDPVGYVTKEADGKYTVVMYEWFKNNLAKGEYQPTLGEAGNGIASKTPEGAGKSPFNNHSVDNFALNMKLLGEKETIFLRREVTAEGRSGVVLYRYKVNKEGTEITRTAESWYGLPTDTPLTTVTYSVGAGKTATEGEITKDGKKGTVKLEDESRRLVLEIEGETEICTLIDYGPDFVERVKGAKFKSTDGKTTYDFSDDGMTLVFVSGGKTYNYKFEQADKDKAKAVYGSKDASAYYAGFQLSEKDMTIQCTNHSAFWAGTVIWNMGYAANRVESLKADFKSSVAGKTFSLREQNGEGYSKTLWSWAFDEAGETATFVTETWKEGAPRSDSGKTVENGDAATVGKIDSKSATLTFDEGTGIWTLNVDSKAYTWPYEDPTPSFLNRVKNTGYVGCGWTYKFSNDGKTITATSGSTTKKYLYRENGNSNVCAVYEQEGAVLLKYYGLKLSSDDYKLTWTWGDGFSSVSEARTYADSASDWAAWKKPLLGKDFHETVASRGWQIRKDDATHGTEAGLELLTWEFSADGKTATLLENKWREDGSTSKATVAITSTGTTSGTGGGYTFTLSSDLMTLTVTGNSESGKGYKFGYVDLGPAWLLRVKDNPIFTGESQFEFRDGGKTLIYDGVECNYDERVTKKHGLGRHSAVYSFPESWGLFDVWWFYGITLSDEDDEITGTSRSSEDIIQWDGFQYTATRQK